MIRGMLISLMLGVVAACGALQTAQAPVGVQTVSDARNTIYAVKGAYGVTIRGATEYIRLPACEKPAAPKLCSSRAVVVQMGKARDAAKLTIDSAEEVVLNATGASTVLSAAVDAAKSAQASFKGIVDIYGSK